MLRPRVLHVCFALGLLVWPAQAHAWWDFIEGFSGPQKFYGWDIQARLFCLVDKVDEKREREGDPKTGRLKRTSVVDEGMIEKQFPPPFGVVVSACKTKKKEGQFDKDTGLGTETLYVRRMAVDVGARFLHAEDPDFASGQRIDFTTLEPAIMINLLSKWPRWDFVDYGFGAGVYWFSSTAFPSFNGAFIEPLRIEFHPTTRMKQSRLASLIPNFRLGWLYFPAGFETADWNARPGIEPRISRERVFSLSIFFDLEPLMR